MTLMIESVVNNSIEMELRLIPPIY
ncbi:MAG: hypothetical protein RI978_941, partial [Verrucomicrobiota bacterium]